MGHPGLVSELEHEIPHRVEKSDLLREEKFTPERL
jgi:hypothetical protein